MRPDEPMHGRERVPPGTSVPVDPRSVDPSAENPRVEDLTAIALDLYEDLRYGYRLNRDGLRDEPRRFAGSADARTGLRADRIPEPWTALREVAARAAASFARGAALELSGGVDSRFVLALGFAAGERPRRAFTIDTGGTDAPVAARLAEKLGIEHRIVRFADRIEPARLVRDAADFVTASGGAANAMASAFLPGVFRELSDFRTEQIGGVGGEVAAGFYRTPVDPILSRLPLSLWIRLRLSVPGSRHVSFFRPAAAAALGRRSEERVRRALGLDGRKPVSWRARVDDLYQDYRLSNWAAVTLEASSHWYRVTMPLMSDAYFAWARGLPAAQHRGKRAQRDFLSAMDPSAAAIPWDLDLVREGARSRFHRLRRKLGRASERLAGAARQAPALARRGASIAVRDQCFADAILELGRPRFEPLGLSSSALERALSDPEGNALELGALATAAVRLGLLGSR